MLYGLWLPNSYSMRFAHRYLPKAKKSDMSRYLKNILETPCFL